VVSYHRTRRSRSALAYGSRSTTAAETSSTRSYTTLRDVTQPVWKMCGRCGACYGNGRREGRVPAPAPRGAPFRLKLLASRAPRVGGVAGSGRNLSRGASHRLRRSEREDG
jgi:hypothetical protein